MATFDKNKMSVSIPTETRPHALTGAAGSFFVASRLAYHGIHASVTFGNAPSVDIIVSSADGGSSLAIQVKTTASAGRTRGRGENKVPHHYEWDIGEKGARKFRPNLYYALVDLRGFAELPDVFIIPSEFIVNWFSRFESLKRYRFHPLIVEIDKFKNDWDSLKKRIQN
jgi:hypothetical protein